LTSQSRIPIEDLPIPYRGRFGDPRPAALADIALPPGPMPGRLGARPLKAWRYIGVYGPELMLCLASIRIGPARQAFWAVWDRRHRRLFERTTLGRGGVRLAPGRAQVTDRDLQLDLELDESAGIETVCPSGRAYGWTRKQGGVPARGRLMLDGEPRELTGRAVIDDTSAYYQRHTTWSWCAGVGTAGDGRALAWNLVSGVNDPDASSERTVWVDGDPHEPPPCTFAPDLTRVDALAFEAEATREHDENLLLVRSSYRQPFGTFSGALPGSVELAEGYGVMEAHDVWW
jgi:hypothetical protein